MAASVCGGMITSARAQEMQFRVEPIGAGADCERRCPKAIIAEGQISLQTAEEFVTFYRGLRREPNVKNVLFIHSPGGFLYGGLEFGQVLRKLGMTVVVARVGRSDGARRPLLNGSCYSACVYALMGGRNRVVPDASEVGVHRIHTRGQLDVADRGAGLKHVFATNDVVADVRRYSRRMGVRPEIVDIAESIGPQEIRRLTAAEIQKLGLARKRL